MNNENNKVVAGAHMHLIKLFVDRQKSSDNVNADTFLSALIDKDEELSDMFTEKIGESSRMSDVNDYFVKFAPKEFEGLEPGKVFILDSIPTISSNTAQVRLELMHDFINNKK